MGFYFCWQGRPLHLEDFDGLAGFFYGIWGGNFEVTHSSSIKR
jgi:hypothetical protein